MADYKGKEGEGAESDPSLSSEDNDPFKIRCETLSLSPISHTWIPVLSNIDSFYRFPEPITGFMRAALRRPAIYRWKISHQNGTTDYYIGETEELCPRRIYHYINPGRSQITNRRLNELFVSRIRQGATVTIDFLSFEPFSVGDLVVNQESLADSHIRKFIEELFVVLMMAKGDTLLNS